MVLGSALTIKSFSGHFKTSYSGFVIPETGEEHALEYSEISASVTFVKLPPYSPDFNPIEQVWRITCRENTHNVFFPTLAMLKMRISLPPAGDMEWRESVHQEFIKAGITPKNYINFVCKQNLKDI